jgi:plastocyanin
VTTPRARSATRSLLAAGFLSTLLLTAACGSSSSAGSTAGSGTTATADGATVDTGLLAFSPEKISIKKGQTVTWVGGDNITHVLVEGTYAVGADKLRTSQTDDKAFHLNLTKKGQKVSHTYTTAGTFTYYCSIHHGMNGTVVVS